MLLTKILNLSRKFLALLTFTIFLNSNLFGVESIDIWNNGKKKDNTQEKKLEDKKKDTQINYSPEDKNLGQIQIEENLNNFDESKELIGLYDPSLEHLLTASFFFVIKLNSLIVLDPQEGHLFGKINLKLFFGLFFISTERI